MARTTAICTRKTCGATFEKSTTKPNRADATSWEEWAVKNLSTTPKAKPRPKSGRGYLFLLFAAKMRTF